MIERILLAVSGLGHGRNAQDFKLPSFKGRRHGLVRCSCPNYRRSYDKVETGGKILATAIQSLNLDPSHVSSILRQGEPKDVVCQVAEEIDADLIIIRGLKRPTVNFIKLSQYVFQLSRPMLLVKDDIYVKKLSASWWQ